jgi:hypothetical protein
MLISSPASVFNLRSFLFIGIFFLTAFGTLILPLSLAAAKTESALHLSQSTELASPTTTRQATSSSATTTPRATSTTATTSITGAGPTSTSATSTIRSTTATTTATSAEDDAPPISAGTIEEAYPPLQTGSHYGVDNDFLSKRKLIASASSGFFIFLGGIFLLLIASNLRKKVRREFRHLEAGIPTASRYDLRKFHEKSRMHRLSGIVLIFASIGIFLGTLYAGQIKIHRPIVFSKDAMLRELWRDYKENYVDPNGRTLDRQRSNITTSEGQSYTMLRAVWINDKETFDKSYSWTKEYMQRDDKLFSWLYGTETDGTTGILVSQGGENSAADADTDIALSLILAYARWGDKVYLEDARTIISAIWDKEVLVINGKPYLVANNLEKSSNKTDILLNWPHTHTVFLQHWIQSILGS